METVRNSSRDLPADQSEPASQLLLISFWFSHGYSQDIDSKIQENFQECMGMELKDMLILVQKQIQIDG